MHNMHSSAVESEYIPLKQPAQRTRLVLAMLPLFYPDKETTTGRIVSLVVGNLINWLLHGVLTVQLYLYYLAFPNDRKWMKAAVYTVYILETVQVISLAIILLLLLITLNVNPELQYDTWTARWTGQAALTACVSGLVSLIAQCIYAYRIRIITRRKVMPGLIITLAILQSVAAILTMVAPLATFLIVLALWPGLNVVNDLIIAFIMVRSLWKENLRVLSDSTKSKVIRLIHLIMATGSLTVIANSLTLVCILSSIGGTVGMPILIFMPKLYANSILVMLNNRMAIRDSRNAKSNIMSTDVPSTLVIADHQIEPSGSVISRNEEPFSSSATTSNVGDLEFT